MRRVMSSCGAASTVQSPGTVRATADSGVESRTSAGTCASAEGSTRPTARCSASVVTTVTGTGKPRTCSRVATGASCGMPTAGRITEAVV